MQNPYYWIPWVISVVAVAITLWREFKSDRATLQKQVQQLEINQAVDRATTAGQLELIRQQLTQTTSAAQRAQQALNSILENES